MQKHRSLIDPNLVPAAYQVASLIVTWVKQNYRDQPVIVIAITDLANDLQAISLPLGKSQRIVWCLPSAVTSYAADVVFVDLGLSTHTLPTVLRALQGEAEIRNGFVVTGFFQPNTGHTTHQSLPTISWVAQQIRKYVETATLHTLTNAEIASTVQKLAALAALHPADSLRFTDLFSTLNLQWHGIGSDEPPHCRFLMQHAKQPHSFTYQSKVAPLTVQSASKVLNAYTQAIAQFATENEQLRDKNAELLDHLHQIFASKKYKLMQAAAKSKVLAQKARKNPKKAAQLLRLLATSGPRGMRDKLSQLVFLADFDEQYRNWVRMHTLTDAEKRQQREIAKQFKYQPTISILTPFYETPLPYLQACITSVLEQTYANWQLCLVDDASPNTAAYDLAKSFAAKDSRIVVKRRAKNGHIAEASNTAARMATGEFLALLDHDDVLWPNALFAVVQLLNEHRQADFIYSDEDKIEEDGQTHSGPFFKPDWSPDYLRSINYITHFAIFRKSLFTKVGMFRKEFDGAQDWDLFLRLTAITNKIYHIPTVLYSWRKSPQSTASERSAGKVKTYAYANQQRALQYDLTSLGYTGSVEPTALAGTWRVRYAIKDTPKISIIIPTKDHFAHITTCIHSILQTTTYANYEIIIVDTGTTEPSVLQFYADLQNNHQIAITNFHKPVFNFSAACNAGAAQASGDYFVFLNNDTEVISPDWLEGMLELAQKPETGAVGVRLLYPNGTIQHLGGILGIPGDEQTLGVGGHAFRGKSKNFIHHDRWSIKNYSFVTAACLMVAREKFNAIHGFDQSFGIAWNDIDFCLRLMTKLHLYNVVTPHVVLIHYESASVAKPGEAGRDLQQFEQEKIRFDKKWHALRVNDPFYNPNLSLKTESFDQIRF